METGTGQSAPEQAKEKAQQVGQQASEKAHDVGHQASEQAKHVSEQAKSKVTDVVDQRSTDAGKQVNSTAQALRETSSKLRENGSAAPARAVESVADRIEGVGTWLQDSDGDAILHDIENYARRQPNAVLIGGLVLGFAASRLLKASSTKRYQSRAGDGYGSGAAGYGSRSGTAGLPPVGTTAGNRPNTGLRPNTGVATGGGAGASAGVGALSGSPTSGLTAEGDTTSAPTSRMGLEDMGPEKSGRGIGSVGGEGEGFMPPSRGA